jgi:hypothetical protein
VSVRGHVVSVGMPKRPQIMCDVIGPGRLTIVLTPSARITNPATAGPYRVTAHKGALAFAARLTVM